MDDEVDANELDRACLGTTSRQWDVGTGELDTVQCQFDFSPNCLFQTVGQTSSRLAYDFERLTALYKFSCEPTPPRLEKLTVDPGGCHSHSTYVQ